MPEVACLTVVAHGVATDQLIFCLRANLSSYNVEVREPDGDRVYVVDLGGKVDSLHDLLDQRLDQCAERLNIPVREHLLLIALAPLAQVEEGSEKTPIGR